MLRSVSLLALASCALSAHALTYTGGGGPILDNASVSRTIAGVAAFSRIDAVTITGLTHTFTSDLVAYLTGPGGVRVDLFSRQGGSRNLNGDYTFAVGGAVFPGGSGAVIPPGTYAPSTAGGVLTDFAAFDGSAGGSFTLTIRDEAGGDQGAFTGWTLSVPPPSAPAVPGPVAALPFALLALKQRKRA